VPTKVAKSRTAALKRLKPSGRTLGKETSVFWKIIHGIIDRFDAMKEKGVREWECGFAMR